MQYDIIINVVSHICRCDGIGRRSGLKIHRWRQRTGSSPVTGTMASVLIAFEKLYEHSSFLLLSAGDFGWGIVDEHTLSGVDGHIRGWQVRFNRQHKQVIAERWLKATPHNEWEKTVLLASGVSLDISCVRRICSYSYIHFP